MKNEKNLSLIMPDSKKNYEQKAPGNLVAPIMLPLVIVELSSNDINDKDTQTIVDVLHNTLALTLNYIAVDVLKGQDQRLQKIMEGLKNKNEMTPVVARGLSIWSYSLEKIELKSLVKVLQEPSSSSLPKLYFACDNIEKVNTTCFTENLKEIVNSITFNVNGKPIEHSTLKYITNILEKSQVPVTCSLQYTSMEDSELVYLAQSLRETKVPVTLHLGNNIIGDEGVKFLAEVLKEIKTPITLYLEHNVIGNEGARAMVEVVSRSKVLITGNYACNNTIQPELYQELEKSHMQNKESVKVAAIASRIYQHIKDTFCIDEQHSHEANLTWMERLVTAKKCLSQIERSLVQQKLAELISKHNEELSKFRHNDVTEQSTSKADQAEQFASNSSVNKQAELVVSAILSHEDFMPPSLSESENWDRVLSGYYKELISPASDLHL